MTELFRYIKRHDNMPLPKLRIPLAINDLPGGGLRCVKTAKYNLVAYCSGNCSKSYALYRLDGRSVSRIPTVIISENSNERG